MNNWNALSTEIAELVDKAAPSIVQVHGRRRATAGVVIAENLIATPASTDDDTVAVLAGDVTHDGVVLGRVANMGLTIVRVEHLNRPALKAGSEPKPGHLGVAVGRTWSGGIMATLAPVAVVGGPLRTGRASAIDRVIRIQQSPHGALNGGVLLLPGDSGSSAPSAAGIVTSMAIRGTTVVIPASIAWAAASKVATEGGSKQGFLGVSSLAVPLPERQRAGRSQEFGLLISHVAPNGPAESAGLLIGDVIVGFDGETVQDPAELVTRLRGNRVGAAVPITVIRGTAAMDVTVTVSARPTNRG